MRRRSNYKSKYLYMTRLFIPKQKTCTPVYRWNLNDQAITNDLVLSKGYRFQDGIDLHQPARKKYLKYSN